jgi:hypothetical protein
LIRHELHYICRSIKWVRGCARVLRFGETRRRGSTHLLSAGGTMKRSWPFRSRLGKADWENGQRLPLQRKGLLRRWQPGKARPGQAPRPGVTYVDFAGRPTQQAAPWSGTSRTFFAWTCLAGYPLARAASAPSRRYNRCTGARLAVEGGRILAQPADFKSQTLGWRGSADECSRGGSGR